MPNKAYQLFLDSMKIEFNQWHDGTGYDLEALGRLGSEEQASIVLLFNLHSLYKILILLNFQSAN